MGRQEDRQVPTQEDRVQIDRRRQDYRQEEGEIRRGWGGEGRNEDGLKENRKRDREGREKDRLTDRKKVWKAEQNDQ